MVDYSQPSTPFEIDIRFGYLDRHANSSKRRSPKFVLNTGTTSMLRAIREHLDKSDNILFSVAFVSPRAIALLKQELIDFNGKATIVTSDYLGFNSPAAFRELLNLQRVGVETRLHKSKSFHPKGYIFEDAEFVTTILGSSNLTESALVSNHEWNIQVSATKESDLADQARVLMDDQISESAPLTAAWIDEYELRYQTPAFHARPLKDQSESPPTEIATSTPPFADANLPQVTPNKMQQVALAAINKVRNSGQDKALVISATGTGKTILAALDVRQAKPRRFLFVVHREQILDRAILEFARVLQKPVSSFGKFTGTSVEIGREYVFATMQTLSRPDNLHRFSARDFDYILIDEVHRAGAPSYSRILEHFRPKFLLGLTATPERTDGFDIFSLFDHNVPYEIRLNHALEEDMLAPFHYYGVTDVIADDEIDPKLGASFSKLTQHSRVDHIISTIELYGQAGVPPRGLIFCSRKEEAHELSRLLNNRLLNGHPLRTVALTGENTSVERVAAVDELEAGRLDYILSVDIFNEGIDIPTINQIIMLRQTQSSIVFVQQLGRGLRKSLGKEYLVVIDFIANYANNYLIPAALFADESLNRESLRKNLAEAQESGVISGLSSIRFDKISQERVLQSITQTRLDSFPNLKQALVGMQVRLGRVPRLAEFVEYESVDPVLLATRMQTYPALVEKLLAVPNELDYVMNTILRFLSNEILTSKRPHESLVLSALLKDGAQTRAGVIDYVQERWPRGSAFQVQSAIRSLTMDFYVQGEQRKYEDGLVETDDDGLLRLTQRFSHAYDSSQRFADEVDDLLDTSTLLAEAKYRHANPFEPGRQYSRKDASRLLGWKKNATATIFGYAIDWETRTCPIFVTYTKRGDVSAQTAYKNVLLDSSTMLWYTKNGRTLTSRAEAAIISNEVDLHVFVKRDDLDGSDFYYLGQASASDGVQTTILDEEGRTLPIAHMHLNFKAPIPTGVYDYVRSGANV